MKKQTSATTEPQVKGSTIVDFSGKPIYVGIDMHQKSWQVAQYYDGLTLGNHHLTSNCQSVVNFLRKRYPGAALKCVYESGSWGFELQRALTAAGIHCIVTNASDVPGSNKEKMNKTDKVDALRLARHYAAGILKGIHVPEQALQKERNLIRFRKKLRGDLTRSKNRLKGLLKFQGIDIPEVFNGATWSHNFMNWIEVQATKDSLLEDTLLLMLDQVRLLRQLLLKSDRKLRALRYSDKYKKHADLLISIPGIGCITAMLFLMEVGDIHRFSTFDQLNSFVGFYPGSHSSGEKEQDTGITQRRHNQLRTALVESAWIAIRVDPALLEAYQQLVKKMKGSEAIVRIARKLLRRMRAILLTGMPYQKGVIA